MGSDHWFSMQLGCGKNEAKKTLITDLFTTTSGSGSSGGGGSSSSNSGGGRGSGASANIHMGAGRVGATSYEASAHLAGQR